MNEEGNQAVVEVLKLIHEDIKGLRESHEHMEKTLTIMTAQNHLQRIEILERQGHEYELQLAALDPAYIKKQIESLRDGQVKLLIKISAWGGGAGLAGGGLVYWIMQIIQAAP